MLEYVREFAAKIGIRNEHHEKEIPRFFGDPIGKDELRVDDVLVEQIDVVAFRIRGIIIVR